VFRIEGDAARLLHDVACLPFDLPARRDIAIVVDVPDADEGSFRFGDTAVGDLSDNDPAALRQDLDLADGVNPRVRAPDDAQWLNVSIRQTVKDQDGFPAQPKGGPISLALDFKRGWLNGLLVGRMESIRSEGKSNCVVSPVSTFGVTILCPS